MNNYEFYKEFLEYLEYKKYSWPDIDNLLEFYKSLNKSDREKFNFETPAIVRFSLMDSFLSRLSRSFNTSSSKEKYNLIENMIYFISLDNYDNDYRETIIRTQGFLETIRSDKSIFQKIWSNLCQVMPEKTQKQINRLADAKFSK